MLDLRPNRVTWLSNLECLELLHLCVKGKPASRCDVTLLLTVLLGEVMPTCWYRRTRGKLRSETETCQKAFLLLELVETRVICD